MTAPARTAIVFTDLDGTLAQPDGTISATDRETLVALGKRGVVRAVATGRSLNGAMKLLEPGFPIDYLIFSSGAGVVEWRTQELVLARNLERALVREGCRRLIELDVDFMVHHPIPKNHHFFYWRNGVNADFERRLERHRECCQHWDGATPIEEASQFLVVDRQPRSAALHESLTKALPSFRVIRATSPLDHETAWLEIFSPQVSKAIGAEWVVGFAKLASPRVLAVGNDFNDLDLLDWAPERFVVGNCPAELRAKYPVVGANVDDGFSDAVRRWLG